ncbi:MAG: hypothetical protein Ct9H300mP25_09060 [Acidobacteriota bacterium]|nr:MAG: hypothetical protein Ct9H300mP25_09060 [Acidobacteriota bacterium]
MTFVLAMVWRELRATWHRFLFFFPMCCCRCRWHYRYSVACAKRADCVGLRGSQPKSRGVYLRTDQPWAQETRDAVLSRLGGIADVSLTETVDTVTMARVVADDAGRTKVVEVRAVQEAFPFYGRFALESGREYSSLLLEQRGALGLGPEVLTQLELSVGDRIAIGNSEFTIRDVIVAEPGRQLGGFSFGPRVLVAYDDLNQTGLLDLAIRAERQILLKGSRGIYHLCCRFTAGGSSRNLCELGSYRRTENRIERHLGRAEDYLSLIGFVVLIIGGIGVWSVTRVFVQQRLRSVAVMKCLGATTERILASMFQVPCWV